MKIINVDYFYGIGKGGVMWGWNGGKVITRAAWKLHVTILSSNFINILLIIINYHILT
jgi:hypothetical protein